LALEYIVLSVILIVYEYMKMGISYIATQYEMIGLLDSVHYMNEEKSEKVIAAILKFLK